MAEYSTSAQTDWTADEAFSYLADLRNLVEWDPGVSTSQLESGWAGEADASYRVVASGTTLVYRMTDFERPRHFTIEATTRFFESSDTITIEEVDGTVIVTYDAILRLKGPAGLLDPALGLIFDRIGDRAARGLQARLARATT